jgi:HPr kinase/phosphorylase
MNDTVHGTAVEIAGYAVLLIGKSGSGKSDLALRLVDRGAMLVGDDYVDIDAGLLVRPAKALAGKIEVSGLGIVEKPHCQKSQLRLIIELGNEGERMPASWPMRDLNGWSVPLLRLNAFAASAPIKVEHAVQSIVDAGLHPVRLSPDDRSGA